MNNNPDKGSAAAGDGLDHTTDPNFYDYYAQRSGDSSTHQRFLRIENIMLRVLAHQGRSDELLDVADVGCGAGTQSILWARRGHRVNGIDISEGLIELGASRSLNAGLKINFHVGSATDLPWADRSMDVCLVPELLEHVQDWRQCLDETIRVLRPGGVLFLSTNNKLCPRQLEFNLPLYSWYPRLLKRYCERLAVTTRPGLANYARYPAVNWFTFFELRDVLTHNGFVSMDRFDVAFLDAREGAEKLILQAIRRVGVLRWFAHVFTPYTLVVAIKRSPRREARE